MRIQDAKVGDTVEFYDSNYKRTIHTILKVVSTPFSNFVNISGNLINKQGKKVSILEIPPNYLEKINKEVALEKINDIDELEELDQTERKEEKKNDNKVVETN